MILSVLSVLSVYNGGATRIRVQLVFPPTMPPLYWIRGRRIFIRGGNMLARLSAYILTLLCAHDFELLAKLRLQRPFGNDKLCWVYRCSKCGYVQKVKS